MTTDYISGFIMGCIIMVNFCYYYKAFKERKQYDLNFDGNGYVITRRNMFNPTKIIKFHTKREAFDYIMSK